jgi:hypothetical protein
LVAGQEAVGIVAGAAPDVDTFSGWTKGYRGIFPRTITAPEKPYIRYFLKHSTLWETIMTKHSTVLIALVLLIGATVPSFAEEGPNQTFTCTAKTFNECLMEAPCSAWKRSGPKAYKLDTKIIFRGNPVKGETISGGTIGDVLETKCGKK